MRVIWMLLALGAAAAMTFGCAGTEKTVMEKTANSGIEGQVLLKNEGAAEGAYVYAYDSPFNDLRVPTKMISKKSDANGSYRLDLSPGEYYIVARKHVDKDDPRGYLQKGDFEGKYPFNPIQVKAGEYTEVNLSISPLEGAFLLAPYKSADISTGITGIVTGMDGNPARGAYVMVYTDPELIGQPQYLSKPCDEDGSYNVALPPGTYYIAARLKYGGLPRKGEPYGTYDANDSHKVTVGEKDLVTDINITLTAFPHDLTKPAD